MLLSVAVLSASAVTWFALQRVDARLQDLHQETLSQVAQALDLSKRSSDLATSAPFLLNQRSNFLIEQEGAKLITVLDRVRDDWPQAQFGDARDDRTSVLGILDSMAGGVSDLVTASTRLDDIQGAIRAQTAKLATLRSTVSAEIASDNVDDATRLIWWWLQSMNADALNAAYAGNLIGVGEEQRHYLRQRQALETQTINVAQTDFFLTLENVVWGDTGVFELRRQELSSNLNAQNALFRIRRNANLINDVASDHADQAEAFLANERVASSRTIRATRISVAAISLVSLALAMTAAIYVSRYVTFNISRVSGAMVRLAKGDHASVLPRRLGGMDEIGDLFRSYRSFRANALRLDRLNRQLDQRNALFEKVFINISDGIAITDAAGRITARNPAFSNIVRLPDAARGAGPFVNWLRDSRFGASALSNNLTHDHRGFCELVSDDGQIVEIRVSKLPDDGRVWLVADVTERRKMSDRLQQIDRIETLGKVAGDTAHDFANILSTIRTHAHLLQGHDIDNSKGSLDAIGNAVDFGASLTDRLLAFARKQSLTPERVDLNALIEGMTDLVEIGLKPDVSLNVTLTPAPLFVLADPGQLESALFNVLLNANMAIDGVGRISVHLEQCDSAQARIVIQDNGVGMADDVLARAIEPFFTTREDNGGTGLGLSIVYGFIRQTGGNLDIESVVGHGTQIEITLPLAAAPEPRSMVIGKTALLVEDDPKTRRFVQDMLIALGYVVTAEATGPAAVSTLDAQKFDLLISDLDLGGEIDGVALVHKAQATSPKIKTMIMSGKSSARLSAQKHITFLQKPITTAMLATVLNGLGPDGSRVTK